MNIVSRFARSGTGKDVLRIRLKKSVGLIMLALLVPQAEADTPLSLPGCTSSTSGSITTYTCYSNGHQLNSVSSTQDNVVFHITSGYTSTGSDNESIQLTGNNETVINDTFIGNLLSGTVILVGNTSGASAVNSVSNTTTSYVVAIGSVTTPTPTSHSGQGAVVLNSASGRSSFNNDGTIFLYASNPSYNASTLVYMDGGTIAFNNTGKVYGSIYLNNLSGLNGDNLITNSGTISGNLTLNNLAGVTTITNSGSISNEVIGELPQGGIGDLGYSSSLIGNITVGNLADSAQVTVKNSSTISGNVSFSNLVGATAATVNNTGTISGNVAFNNLAGTTTATITNTGTIAGSVSFSSLNGTGQINISNTGGTIGGDITVTGTSSNPVSITNAGSIAGKVDMTQLAAGLGTFTVMSGSSVNGKVASNGGILVLSGSGGGSVFDGLLTYFSGFSQLQVQSGEWTWNGGLVPSNPFSNLQVDGGASLKLDSGASITLFGSTYSLPATVRADTIVLGDNSTLTVGGLHGGETLETQQINATPQSRLVLGVGPVVGILQPEDNNSDFFDHGTLQLGSNAQINTLGNISITIGANVTSDGSSTFFTPTLDKEGSGTLILSGTNTSYTGKTKVNAGTLSMTTPLSVLPGSVTVSSGATYALNFSNAADYTFGNNTNTLAGNGTFSVDLAGGAFTFGSGMAGFVGTFVINNATVDMSNVTAATLAGTSILSLAANSQANISAAGAALTNTLNLNGGTLNFTTSPSGSPYTVAVNALTVSSAGGNVIATFNGNPLVISPTAANLLDMQRINLMYLVSAANPVSQGVGTILNWEYPNTTPYTVGTATATYGYGAVVDSSGILAYYGIQKLALGGDFTISSRATNTQTWSVLITGTGNLTLDSGQSAPLIIGNQGSDYTGSTTVTSGTTVQLGSDNALGNTSNLILDGSATLDMQGKSQTIGQLTAASSSTLDLTGTLTIKGGGTAAGGVLQGVGGTLNLTSGTLNVTGSNSGLDATVNLGAGATAILTDPQGLGSGLISLAIGSQLVYNSTSDSFQVTNTLSGSGMVYLNSSSNGSSTFSFVADNTTGPFSGSFEVGDGSTLSVSQTVTGLGSAQVVLAAGGTLMLSQINNGTVANILSGSGRVEVDGSNIRLTGSSPNFLGTFTIENSSTLTAATASLGTDTNIANYGTLVLDTGSGILNSTISGTGNIQVNAGSNNTITLTGDNTFSGGTTVNSGTLSVTPTSIGDGAGTISIESGATYSLTTDRSYKFTNPLAGPGTLTVNLGSSTNLLTFGSQAANNGFSGTLELQDATLALDSNSASLLGSGTDTTLRLDSGGTLMVGQNAALSTLQLNGGTVEFTIAQGATPEGILTLKSLVLGNNAATTGYVTIDVAPAIQSKSLQPSLFAQSENGTIVLAEITNVNTQDAGRQLPTLLNGAQAATSTTSTSATATREDIYDGSGNKVAIATYDYATTVTVTPSGAGGTLSLGYDLINLELLQGQVLTLATNGSIDDNTLGASLTGSGGILVDAGGATAILAGANTYTGPTTLTNGTVQLNADHALGQTSSLSLLGAQADTVAASLDLNGHAQTVGKIATDQGTTIKLGDEANQNGLTITQGGSIEGTLTGYGTLDFAGGTTQISSANPDLYAAVTIGTTESAATVNITQQNGLGTGSITLGSADSVLGLSGVSALGNVLGGSGTVQISAGSTLIGGNNATFTGKFVISSGAAMSVSGASNLGGAGVNIDTGGVLNLMVPASTTATSSAYGNLSTTLSGGGTVNIGVKSNVSTSTDNTSSTSSTSSTTATETTLTITREVGSSGTENTGIEVTLVGDNSGFSGSFNVNTGSILSVTQSAGLGSAQVNLAAGSALILDQVNGTVANTLSGSGTVNLNSTGVALTGNNAAFSGSFAIDSASVLTVSQANNLGNASINDAGSLVLNLSEGSTLSNVISGSGSIQVNASTARVLLTGDSSAFSGTTTVNSGILSVNGQLGGTLAIQAGARLQGNGTVGPTTLTSATLAPGNSIGTLTVNGDLRFDAGSTYEAEINGAGQGDSVYVTGKAYLAGTLSLIKAVGAYMAGTRYTLLTAREGLQGAFSSFIQNLAFVDLTLVQDNNHIYLDVLRNSTGFAEIANTRNEKAVANAIQGMPTDSALYSTIINMQNAASVRRAFAMLSGEAYASAQSYLLDDSHQVRDAAINRLRSATLQDNADGPAAWGQAYGSLGSVDSDGNAAKMTYHQSGVLAGTDSVVGSWRVGVVGGYGQSRLKVDTYNSRTDMNTYHLGVYGGTSVAALNIRVGGTYSWNGVKAKRNPDVAGQSLNNSADYHAHTLQAFAEVGYTLDAGPVSVEPLLNVAYVRTSTDAFRESGSSLSALQAESDKQSVVFSTLGARVSKVFSVNATDVAVQGNFGWRHAAGDTGPTARLRFTESQDFTVAGVPIAKNVAVLGLGASVKVSKNTDIALNYAGQLAKSARENSVQANFVWKF